MVKHTQTIRRQFADELFECVWPFCEIGSKLVSFIAIMESQSYRAFMRNYHMNYLF